MPIEIKAKRRINVDEEGNEIVEEKPFHVKMYKYNKCPFCGYDGELIYYPQLDVYECPYCGRGWT